jgi:rhamnose utilization protein RhaD (predicted bifunctional aldolase and dehydrogenase)/NAD(P)-dependent dehydrogenase (short-subunit alcohol dehydrogenase family)
MQNRWSDADAAQFPGLLGARVYTSRLLGIDPELVMHGGGNTSVKLRDRDLFGNEIDVLAVKGSGSDLATMTESGFAPVRMGALLALAQLDELSDTEMANQLRLACTRAGAPAPSVEAILHAILPDRFVDHTHADAVIALTNTPNPHSLVQEVFGDRVIVIDYVMPGFALARECAAQVPKQRTRETVGMVLMQHGIFSFGDTARESYDRMIELVGLAEGFLASRGAWELPEVSSAANPARADRAALRTAISHAAGAPMILRSDDHPRVAAYVQRTDLAEIATRGPLTPDHVIRTKRVPLVGRDVDAYVAEYEAYFVRNRGRAAQPLTMLDPAPRVVLDPELGLLTAGRTPRDAAVARDIARHTIDVVERATMLDAWDALDEEDIFDVEYWELEQAKLGKAAPAPLAGEIVLVTGAASGIGAATAAAFNDAGAAVVGLDLDATIVTRSHDAFLGVECDITDADALDRAFDAAVQRFGGVDMVVCNAGMFPPSAPIASLTDDLWRRVMAVNLDANVALLRAAAPLLAQSPRGGRVVVNASKNVAAPGPGAAAYSASKAALTQLARVAALEWAPQGIRVNVVHPNAVFDTGIWDDATLSSRAKSYGLSVEEYKRNNLLGVEVASTDVAAVIVALCSPTFAKTTGAQIPIDGGNERVI